MSDPLLFPQFYLHCHYFLLCISPHSSSEIMSAQKILKIFLSHPFMNVYRSLVIRCGTFCVQVWHYFNKFTTMFIKYRSHQKVELQDVINLFTLLLAFSLIVGHAFLAVKRVNRRVASFENVCGCNQCCLKIELEVFFAPLISSHNSRD